MNSQLAPGLGTVLVKIEADEQALALLVSADGVPFKAWYEKANVTRREYEAVIRKGFPKDPMQAAIQAPVWEGYMAFAEQQAAIAGSYTRRARAVARELLTTRGAKATEAGAEARTWRQAEEADRWAAVARSFQEWVWESRGRDKGLIRPGGPGR